MPTSDSPLQMPASRFTNDEKQHRANNQALETFGNIAFFGFVPVGGVILYAGAFPPAGYLDCNGAAINRRAYAALFSVISTTYGVGDGSTTFNIPNEVAPGALSMYLIRTGVY